MQLFFDPSITTPLHTLSEQESRHAVSVLRMGHGHELYLTDGKGSLHLARIEQADPKRCTVRIEQSVEEFERRPYRITMAVAPMKNNERFEWFVEKAVEVGIDRIIPIDCRHSERHVYNVERAERVAISAMKQSLKAYLPQIDPLTPFEQLIAMPFDGERFIAHCHASDKRLYLGDVLTRSNNALILIGPEGDFSPEEVETAIEAGFVEISLSQARLRSETAALMCVMIASTINNMHP